MDPTRAREMTDEQFRDFVDEMIAAAHEEAHLWELPRGVVDRLPGGDVLHGPWAAADCSTVFLAWFDEGLVGVYRLERGEDGRTMNDLGPSAARQLLAEPDRWALPGAVGEIVNVFRTDKGVDVDPDRWRELASRHRHG
ncbi:MAG: hypothetical protein ACT4QF_07430 [Sporichthyaceae bacterium]